MIFEILVIATIVASLTFVVVRFFQNHKIEFDIIVTGCLACVSIIFVSFFVSTFAVGFSTFSSIEPVSKTKLQLLDGKYVVKNADTYYFKYDDNIYHDKKVYIIDINDTNQTEPVIFKCHLKHSWLVPKVFTEGGAYYVLVVPNDSSLLDDTVPSWLSQSQATP